MLETFYGIKDKPEETTETRRAIFCHCVIAVYEMFQNELTLH